MDWDNLHCGYIHNRNMLSMYHTWRWTVTTYTVTCTIPEDGLWQPTLCLHLQQKHLSMYHTWRWTVTTYTVACTIPEDGLWQPTLACTIPEDGLWQPTLCLHLQQKHLSMYHTWRWTVTTYTVTCTIPDDGLWQPTLWHVPYLKMDCGNLHCDMYHTWRWTVATYTVPTSTTETCSACTIPEDGLWQPTLWLHLQITTDETPRILVWEWSKRRRCIK